MNFDTKTIVKIAVGAILGIVFVTLLLNSFYVVNTGEVGIVTRFGTVQRVNEAGFMLKLPISEHVTTMNVRVQKEEVTSSGATKDLQDVSATLALNYSVNKETALNIYKDLGVEYKDNIIIPALQESFKAGVSQFTSEDLITNRMAAKENVLDAVRERLAGYGITVSDFNIVNLEFSDEFNSAIEAKAVAQQEVEKAKQELEKVKIEAEQKIARAQADAEAQKLQQQTLTELMIKKMWIEKWNGNVPSTMAGDSGFMINLGK